MVLGVVEIAQAVGFVAGSGAGQAGVDLALGIVCGLIAVVVAIES